MCYNGSDAVCVRFGGCFLCVWCLWCQEYLRSIDLIDNLILPFELQ